MIARAVEPKVIDLLDRFPVVAILGPRQVGKTTLALIIAETLGQKGLYLDLELPSDRAKLSDPELYLSHFEDQLVIIDEIHRLPDIFNVLRSLVDRWRRKGKRSRHFLLLGSASIDLMKQSAESLAGRIVYQELTPFSIPETMAAGVDHLNQLWVSRWISRQFSCRRRLGKLQLAPSFHPNLPRTRCSRSGATHSGGNAPAILANAGS